MVQSGWWKPPLLLFLTFTLVAAWSIRGIQYYMEFGTDQFQMELSSESISDMGEYALPEGMTIENIRLERDPQHPDQLVFRFTTRPLRPSEQPRTRVVYIKDGTQ